MSGLLVSRMPNGAPEVFSSVQGEGVSMGVPSTFLRLAVCNLRCKWCDTAYTWDWFRYRREDQVMECSAEELAGAILARAPRNVVITGGEPLIQRRALVPLVARLRASDCRIEVETNGTIAPVDLADIVTQWNVSPKLAHSGNEGLARTRPAALRAFAALDHAFFKFVVDSPTDLEEVEQLRDEYCIPAERVVLMPEGTTAAALASRAPWLAEVCTNRGYRFSTRLHILIWGDKRGV